MIYKNLRSCLINRKGSQRKCWQSDSKSLDTLAESKTKSQHFRHWIWENRECELVFEDLDSFSILSSRWIRSNNQLGNPYPSPLAREDDSQVSNISRHSFTDLSLVSDRRRRHFKILLIPFDWTYEFQLYSNGSHTMNKLLHISMSYIQIVTKIESRWPNLFCKLFNGI